MLSTTQNTRVYGLIRSPYVMYLRDAVDDERVRRLEFHVKSGDYFAMLASALGFVEETLGTCNTAGEMAERQRALVSDMRKDLTHLHKNYKIKGGEGGMPMPSKGIHRF